jgi:anti-sigma factor RsiW
MSDCSEISLLLGAFEDGELEPHEMQDVAYHLARCDSCTGEIAGIGTLGRELRAAITMPSLDGFTSAVMKRIDNLPQPLWTRISNFFARSSERLSSGFAMGAAMAAVAAITTVIVTPYAQRFAAREGATPLRMAAAKIVPSHANATPLEIASAIPQDAAVRLANAGQDELPVRELDSVTHDGPDDVPLVAPSEIADEDSHADISRLESDIPNVAVWSEPQDHTTVIWLPDQH